MNKKNGKSSSLAIVNFDYNLNLKQKRFFNREVIIPIKRIFPYKLKISPLNDYWLRLLN